MDGSEMNWLGPVDDSAPTNEASINGPDAWRVLGRLRG